MAEYKNRLKTVRTVRLLPSLMLFCILAGLLFSATTATVQAQDFILDGEQNRISNEEANQFYDQCVEVPDPVMSGDTQMEMCACMAVELQNSMTESEYKQIKEGIPPGTDIYTKHLTYVYGPCIEGAVRDYISLDCLADRRYRGYTTDIRDMCRCLSNEMGRFASIYAPDILAESLHRNPYFEDAMTPLINTPAFMKEKREAANRCMDKYSWDKNEQR